MGNTHSTGATSEIQTWQNRRGQVDGSVEYCALEGMLKNVRSERVRSAFCEIPETEYTDKNEIRIWASTYNLNGRRPPDSLDFESYVQFWSDRWPKREKEFVQGSPNNADIYVMGFQEIVPLTAQNIIAGWTSVPVGWDKAIDRTLNPWKTEEQLVSVESDSSVIDYYVSNWSGVPSGNLASRVDTSLKESATPKSENKDKIGQARSKSDEPDLIAFDEDTTPGSQSAFYAAAQERKDRPTPDKHEEFVQLFKYQLVGLYTTGWVRKSFLDRISGVQVTTVATGALGYLANKGAISVRLRIDDSCFVFVTSHLASGSGEGDQLKRNLDFLEIVRRTQFPHEVQLIKMRNEDGKMVEDFTVPPEGLPDNPSRAVRKAFVGGNWGDIRSLKELDNIIWVGDLNYRLKAKAKEAIGLIRSNKLQLLLEVDQLSIERAAGKVFQNFIEAPIDFPPTYKFVRGTDHYTGEVSDESSSESDEPDISVTSLEAAKDLSSFPIDKELSRHVSLQDHSTEKVNSTRSDKNPERTRGMGGPSSDNLPMRRNLSSGDIPVVHKKEEKQKKPKKIRTPAWTDRILWHSSKKQLHQLLYGCVDKIHISDHKPVVSTFILEARKFNPAKVENCIQEARRNIDVEEMASIPRCKLAPTVLEVGNVGYKKPVDHIVTITNVGEVPAVFSFIPADPTRHVLRSPFPSWLSAHPTSGVINPGKKENIKLRVMIEGGQWGSANELFGLPENKLDHILVLHVEGGSDFFVSIMGSFTLSCFGLSFENLAQMLPKNQGKRLLTRTVEIRLPSVEQAKLESYAGWEVPVTDRNSEGSHQSDTRPANTLEHTPSLATTGLKPNLVEGPTGLMIPSQVSRMLYFLADENRLRTNHLFFESFKNVMKTVESKSELTCLDGIRESLDSGSRFPSSVTAHEMAYALFMFFVDLPSPMIPESIAQNCEASDMSAVLAMSLLKEAMSAVEWGVFDSTMELMRSALVDENSRKNRLTLSVLSEILAQVFFQDIDKPPSIIRSASKRYEATATESHKALIHKRRSIFVQQFLRMDKPLIDLDEITSSEISYKSLE